MKIRGVTISNRLFLTQHEPLMRTDGVRLESFTSAWSANRISTTHYLQKLLLNLPVLLIPGEHHQHFGTSQ